jgi:uncharacterized protein
MPVAEKSRTDTAPEKKSEKKKLDKKKPDKKESAKNKSDKKKPEKKKSGKKAAADSKPAKLAGPIYKVRNSPVHGKGVFAAVDIEKGTRIIEYRGKLISNDEIDDLPPSDPNDEHHTFFFSLADDKQTIDASQGGNAARWINHHCKPNCKTKEKKDETGRPRVYIHAKKNIKAGTELNYDYHLTLEGRVTKKDKLNHKCLCGAKKCRGTMLDVD